jgi:lysine 2,3-aminomutase
MAWSQTLEDTIVSIDDIAGTLRISDTELEQLRQITEIHPLRLTRHVLDRIDPEDPNDPLRLMYVPNVDELDLEGTYDTSGEQESTKTAGLQHKYDPTVLLLSTNRCAIYCRYCFRKRLVGLSTSEILSRFDEAVAYIRDHREVTNVLITGGDPLVLPTPIIREFLERLADIDHLQFIRFGTKTVATLPERWLEDDELVDLMADYNSRVKPVYLVTHISHPKEISEEVAAAAARIRRAGLVVSNQAVYLKGVNDDSETLVSLMNSIVRIGLVPYYLFQCRPVKRVQKSYQVSLERGYSIVREARKKLNGHAKRFRYAMSHHIGKIEIVGIHNDEMIFQIHEARDTDKTGTIFTRPLDQLGGWLGDLSDI